MKIILGSASKARQRVLKRAGYEFEVMQADIDERAIRLDNPGELALALAKAKAEALLQKIKESAMLITADQVVYCNNRILEKPKNEEEARLWMKWYTIFPAICANGLVIINTATQKRREVIDISTIKFKPVPDEVIDGLIKEQNIFTQAGAFSAEDPLSIPYIEYIHGSLDSIEGLNLDLVKKFIKELEV